MDSPTTVTVSNRQSLASGDVVELTLAAPEGALPSWEPGAHIDLMLPSGLCRQYSLCGPPESDTYRIAVLRELESRGGSTEIHDNIVSGETLEVRGPRNHFPLVDASHYLFIAGGIGITPLLAMVRKLGNSGASWELHYGGRSRSTLAYVDELQSIPGGSVTVYPQDEVGHIPLSQILASAPADSVIYTCGPEPLLTAVQGQGDEHGIPVHLERFGPARTAPSIDHADTDFTVTLARSHRTLPVPAGTRLIDVVRTVVPSVPFSCEEGYCGSCETAVLEGTPDHRDTVLTDEEREAGDCMMICVGRSCSPQLVLDL